MRPSTSVRFGKGAQWARDRKTGSTAVCDQRPECIAPFGAGRIRHLDPNAGVARLHRRSRQSRPFLSLARRGRRPILAGRHHRRWPPLRPHRRVTFLPPRAPLQLVSPRSHEPRCRRRGTGTVGSQAHVGSGPRGADRPVAPYAESVSRICRALSISCSNRELPRSGWRKGLCSARYRSLQNPQAMA